MSRGAQGAREPRLDRPSCDHNIRSARQAPLSRSRSDRQCEKRANASMWRACPRCNRTTTAAATRETDRRGAPSPERTRVIRRPVQAAVPLSFTPPWGRRHADDGHHIVDVHRSGGNPERDAAGAREVATPHASHFKPNGVSFATLRLRSPSRTRSLPTRTKCLLARDAHLRRHVREDRGREEVAGPRAVR